MTQLMLATLLFSMNLDDDAPGAPMCFASDVKQLCCPSACAAKNTPGKWTQANEILRGCMRGLGCKSGVDSATVGMLCDCGN